jgi:hypothetical protein
MYEKRCCYSVRCINYVVRGEREQEYYCPFSHETLRSPLIKSSKKMICGNPRRYGITLFLSHQSSSFMLPLRLLRSAEFL